MEVEGDAGRLAQVVSNLLNNSAKYSDDGSRIELTLEANGDEAIVRVSDTGIGIEPAMLPTNLRSVYPGEKFDEPLREKGWGSDWPWCAT